MKGNSVHVWADVALTIWNERYHLWEPVNGSDYTKDVKPDGFESEAAARDYWRRLKAMRKNQETDPFPGKS